MAYPVVIWAGRLAATLNKFAKQAGDMCDPGLEEFSRPVFLWPSFKVGHDGGHMSKSPAAGPAARYRPETRLVHSGTLRSEFGETSEGLFLTQGYVYDSAELCEARFKGEDAGYIYSR
jgi:hypothetical protein